MDYDFATPDLNNVKCTKHNEHFYFDLEEGWVCLSCEDEQF